MLLDVSLIVSASWIHTAVTLLNADMKESGAYLERCLLPPHRKANDGARVPKKLLAWAGLAVLYQAVRIWASLEVFFKEQQFYVASAFVVTW